MVRKNPITNRLKTKVIVILLTLKSSLFKSNYFQKNYSLKK